MNRKKQGWGWRGSEVKDIQNKYMYENVIM